MKTYISFNIIFVLTFFGVVCSDFCDSIDAGGIIKVIAAWVGNGFPTKFNPSACMTSDGKIYGECFSSYFHEKPPLCHIEYLVSHSLFPKCAAVFEKETFHHIISKSINWDSFKTALGLFDTVLYNYKNAIVDPEHFCDHMKLYIENRINAFEDGHVNETKMEKYCTKNEKTNATCSAWNLFFVHKFPILKSYAGFLAPLKGIGAVTQENVVNATIKAFVEYAIVSGKLRNLLIPCMQQFFEIFTKKLS